MNIAEIGKRGEECALKYLQNKGFFLLEKNFECRYGEIDLIVKNDKFIVFVEVKTRTENTIGQPREWVTTGKQQRIIKTALLYLQKNDVPLQPRFDVIEVFPYEINGKNRAKVKHFESAFEEI